MRGSGDRAQRGAAPSGAQHAGQPEAHAEPGCEDRHPHDHPPVGAVHAVGPWERPEGSTTRNPSTTGSSRAFMTSMPTLKVTRLGATATRIAPAMTTRSKIDRKSV